MKKAKTYILIMALCFGYMPLRAQFIVEDPAAIAAMATEFLKNAQRYGEQIGEIRRMTRWISDTWEKSQGAIKGFKRAQEFYQKANQVTDYMRDIRGYVQRDGAILSYSFKKETDRTLGEVRKSIQDGMSFIGAASGTGKLTFAERVELVNKALGKVEEALRLLNGLKIKVEDDYIETETIEAKEDLRNAVYESFTK